MTTEERITKFWSLVRKIDDETSCWIWLACTSKSGYGVFFFDGKPQRAHRISFKLVHGYYPNIGRHKCDTKNCVRPDHILDGNKADNAKDAIVRGKWDPKACGKLGGKARNLSPDEASWIGRKGGLAKALGSSGLQLKLTTP